MMICSKPVFNRTMVLSAVQGFEDQSAENLNQVCHFLEAFQVSPQAWCICSDLLWELDEHNVNVLLLCGTMLRHKIRDQINTLSGEQQSQLRDTLLEQLKRAASSPRPGFDAIVRLLALTIADLGLRLPNWKIMISDCISELWLCAPSALLQVVQLLPEQSVQEQDVEQQQLLFDQGPMVIQLLTNFQNRADVDMICMWRSCLLTYGAWANGGFLPMDDLLDHSIVLQAITLIEHPETLERRLFSEACQCIIGLITYATRVSFCTDMDLMYALRRNMFSMISGLTYDLRKLPSKERHECTQVINRLTEVFSGISLGNGYTALLHTGPRCFELQLKVVEHCKIGTVLTSLNQWLQLAERLQTRYELELYYLYQPLVKNFFVTVFPMCRLPMPGPQQPSVEQWDVLMSFRSQVSDLLPKFADLLDLRLFMSDLVEIARNPDSAESDIELTLFFVQPLIKVLHAQYPHLLEELLGALPTLYDQVTIYSHQLISCLANCLNLMDKQQLSHKFVQHLYHICSKSNHQQLRLAAVQAYDLLVLKYKDLSQFEQLYRELRNATSLD